MFMLFIVPAEQSVRGDYEMCSVCVWMCVVNIVKPAVDWPPLLHTLTDPD